MKRSLQIILALVLMIGLGSSLIIQNGYAQILSTSTQIAYNELGATKIWPQSCFDSYQLDHLILIDPLTSADISGEEIQSWSIQLQPPSHQNNSAPGLSRSSTRVIEIQLFVSDTSKKLVYPQQ